MQNSVTAIARFFQSFETHSSSGNFAAAVAQFADVFMAAGSQGAQSVRASDFALILPKRKQLFDSLGCRSTTLVSLHETPLDARYIMAKTQWCFTFDRGRGATQQVLADSVYIVDTGGDTFKIVFYLANQDIFAKLKDRGIMPAG